MTIQTELQHLAEWRQTVEHLREDVEVAKLNLEMTSEYDLLKKAKDKLAEASPVITTIENTVRELGVKAWEASDKTSKKFPGFSISERTVVTVLDEKKAKQWAAINAPSVLSLTAKFKSTVEELEVDFVKVEKVATVGIASDLTEFLPDANSNIPF